MRKLILLLLLVGICMPLYAEKSVELTTVYKSGVFETTALMETDVSMEILSSMITDLDRYIHNFEIDSLAWATNGLSGNEKGKDILWMEYNKGEYDSIAGVFSFFIDIYTGIIKKQIKNLEINVLLKKELNSEKNMSLAAKLSGSNLFLKNASGVLFVQKIDEKSCFIIKSSVQFGWFFNLFVSKSNYNAVVEWRLKKLLSNLNTEAERRK